MQLKPINVISGWCHQTINMICISNFQFTILKPSIIAIDYCHHFVIVISFGKEASIVIHNLLLLDMNQGRTTICLGNNLLRPCSEAIGLPAMSVPIEK